MITVDGVITSMIGGLLLMLILKLVLFVKKGIVTHFNKANFTRLFKSVYNYLLEFYNNLLNYVKQVLENIKLNLNYYLLHHFVVYVFGYFCTIYILISLLAVLVFYFVNIEWLIEFYFLIYCFFVCFFASIVLIVLFCKKW